MYIKYIFAKCVIHVCFSRLTQGCSIELLVDLLSHASLNKRGGGSLLEGLRFHISLWCELSSFLLHVQSEPKSSLAAPKWHLFFILKWRSCRRLVETCWGLLSLSRKCLGVCEEQNCNLSNVANLRVLSQYLISLFLLIGIHLTWLQDDQLLVYWCTRFSSSNF